MLTAAHVSAALKAAGAGGGLVASPLVIAELFNDAIAKYGDGQFDTTEKVAALVSESMMESAYFRTTQEYANTGSYQPYRGRTFIQITWKSNYAAFGAWCKSVGLLDDAGYFVDNPTRLNALTWAAVGPVWYFTKVLFHGKPLTAYASSSLQVGRAVNMGDPFSRYTPNGQKARDAAYKAVLALGPSIIPTPAKPAPTGKAIDMANADNVWINYTGNQALKPGDNEVWISTETDGTHNKTVVSNSSAGVDILATLDLVDAAGQPYAGRAGSFFRVVSYKDGTPTTTTSSRKPTYGDQVSFKGALTADKTAGRSARLRLVVNVPTDATGLVLRSVQFSGWKI